MRPPFLTLALTAGLSLVGPITPADGQQIPSDPFLGTWQGTLDTGRGTLRLVIHVDQDDSGALTGTLDSPDQGATGLQASSVTVADGTLHFALERLKLSYDGTLSADGTTLSGIFRQAGAELPLHLTRGADAPAGEGEPAQPTRPQNPKPPFPYRTEEVSVSSVAGVTLAGTLTLPPGDGPFPAAVLVTGSGPQDRDETLMGHKPFLVLSDHLTRQGIAVLRYDDRGVAGSTGDFASATTEDFTDDALAAVAFLKSRSDIGPVGIVGHSEGGLVGPLAASRSDQVDFVVMLAGPGIPGDEILRRQAELISRAGGMPEEEIRTNVQQQARVLAALREAPDSATAAVRVREVIDSTLASLTPEARARLGQAATPEGIDAQVRQVDTRWFRFFIQYDPRPTLERVRVPVLALNGGKDLQVPADIDLHEVAAALERGGNPDVTTRLLPGLNHLFQQADTGAPSEYASIQETMNPAVLEAVSTWILSRFGSP